MDPPTHFSYLEFMFYSVKHQACNIKHISGNVELRHVETIQCVFVNVVLD